MELAHHGQYLPEVSFALHVLVKVRRAHLHDLLDRVRQYAIDTRLALPEQGASILRWLGRVVRDHVGL